MSEIEQVDQGNGAVERWSVRYRWIAALAASLVVVALMVGLSSLTAPAVSYAQVTQPTPDVYVVSMEFVAVSEDSIADTATAVFGAYANVIWLTGGIALGFYTLRRARALLR